jgi:ubiquinone/menaquinone biosynthesis C-methylase UbiE
MNIADTKTLAREAARVLRRNGRFSCVEFSQGGAGPLSFPLPWASDPSTSFLATPEEMRTASAAAGLRVEQQLDFAAVLEKLGPPPRQAIDVVMGDDFATRAQNAMAALKDGRLIHQFILAEKA